MLKLAPYRLLKKPIKEFMMTVKLCVLSLIAIGGMGCATATGKSTPKAAAVAAPSSAASAPVTKPIAPAVVAPSPADKAEARRLAVIADEEYRQGAYEKAEQHLKQAMILYPFIADAALTLGKVLLIRGSATQDHAMLNNARLMFEMARSLDPRLREVDLLLQLFRVQPIE